MASNTKCTEHAYPSRFDHEPLFTVPLRSAGCWQNLPPPVLPHHGVDAPVLASGDDGFLALLPCLNSHC